MSGRARWCVLLALLAGASACDSLFFIKGRVRADDATSVEGAEVFVELLDEDGMGLVSKLQPVSTDGAFGIDISQRSSARTARMQIAKRGYKTVELVIPYDSLRAIDQWRVNVLLHKR